MVSVAAGQVWSYRAPTGFEASRMVVGAVVRFDDHEPIICASVLGAPVRAASGTLVAGEIPFIPMTEPAFLASVERLESGALEAAASTSFTRHLDAWRDDARGLSVFTVPFDGLLEHLVARQMAAIAGLDKEVV